ncbi:MAG TPA: hypothetical protein VFA93_02570, partial [Patescibacteria group bacterium]|nr:hypothetical protein [Patescibacteria group bacterium]
MISKFFKPALSIFLAIFLLLYQIGFPLSVFADEIASPSASLAPDPNSTPSSTLLPEPTPSATSSATLSSPTPVPVPSPVVSDWQVVGDDATTLNNVELNKVYTAPQDGKVTVKFDKLTTPGKLTIKKISTQNLSSIDPVADTAYDISSDMQNGTFEYTLTLPTPKTQN